MLAWNLLHIVASMLYQLSSLGVLRSSLGATSVAVMRQRDMVWPRLARLRLNEPPACWAANTHFFIIIFYEALSAAKINSSLIGGSLGS